MCHIIIIIKFFSEKLPYYRICKTRKKIYDTEIKNLKTQRDRMKCISYLEIPPPRSRSIDICHTLIFCFIRASILYTSTTIHRDRNQLAFPIRRKEESQFYSDSQTVISTSREMERERESQRTRNHSSVINIGTTTFSHFFPTRILSGPRNIKGKMSVSILARRRSRLSGIVNPMFARYEIKGSPRRIPLTFSQHGNTLVS